MKTITPQKGLNIFFSLFLSFSSIFCLNGQTSDQTLFLDANGNASLDLTELTSCLENSSTNCIPSRAQGDGHALWLKNNIFPGSSTDFLFEEGADFQHNQDGTGTITGILYNTNNPTDKWRVEFFMSEGRTWEEWSALGRSYKDEKNLAGDNYKDWLYFIEDPSQVSQLIGMEDNAGKTLEITHMPADYKYGFQLGVGANSKNADYGFAGWFFYSWDGVNYHQGDFNLDLSGCNTTTPDVTITASQETFSCNDLGEKALQLFLLMGKTPVQRLLL